MQRLRLLLLAALAAVWLRADELARLRTLDSLTPGRFLSEFADFAFELGEHVQEAETFLTRKRGDCDDFASLAARVLTERGYRTKLVVVMMPAQTHVVCYVREAQGFLDFNRRAMAEPVVAADGSLEDVATKVARSFRSPWWMAAEVEYKDRQAVFIESAFPLESAPAATEPLHAAAATARAGEPAARPQRPEATAGVMVAKPELTTAGR